MKEIENWHDRLAALRSSMGQTEPEESEPVPSVVTADAHETARLDIVFEKKGRAGKTATIISGFSISDTEIENLASAMKRALGTGGSSRGGEILIQGDRRSDVLRYLTSKGFKARII